MIAFCGGYKEELREVLLGGPMMGIAIPSDNFQIMKQSNGVLFFSEKVSNQKTHNRMYSLWCLCQCMSYASGTVCVREKF